MVAMALVIPVALLVGFIRLRHLAVAMIFGAVLMMAMPLLATRVASIGNVVLQSIGLDSSGFRNADSASRGRVTEMQAAGLMFVNYPLLGVGPGMAPEHYPQYAQLVGGKVRVTTRRSHNLYLQLAAETGVIGLCAFLSTLWVVLYSIDVARRRAECNDRELWGLVCGLELAVLILLATSLFLHAAYIRYFWLLLALAVAAARLTDRPIQARVLPPAMRNEIGWLERQA
jgi:O-antigen ligase